MKVFISSCCDGTAASGYVAASVWRNVHVDRPRFSTSAGQSSGKDVNLAVVEGGAALYLSAGTVRPSTFLAVAAQARNAVPELQVLHGFPSFPIIMPGGTPCFEGWLPSEAPFSARERDASSPSMEGISDGMLQCIDGKRCKWNDVSPRPGHTRRPMLQPNICHGNISSTLHMEGCIYATVFLAPRTYLQVCTYD